MVAVRNFLDTYETCKLSFISEFSICFTVPLRRRWTQTLDFPKFSYNACLKNWKKELFIMKRTLRACTFSMPKAISQIRSEN